MIRATDPSSDFPWLVEDDDGVTLYVLTQPDAVENRYMGVDGKFLKFKSARLIQVALRPTEWLRIV